MLRVKRDFFQVYFEYFCLTSFFPSLVYVTQCLQINSKVFEVSKILSTVFMMLEVRWTAVENVVFFNKRSTVITLPVMFMNLRNMLCRNEISEDES